MTKYMRNSVPGRRKENSVAEFTVTSRITGTKADKKEEKIAASWLFVSSFESRYVAKTRVDERMAGRIFRTMDVFIRNENAAKK